ncbi:CPBP family intramembrane metalloprotease [Saccharopolyspora indica]|uniref:CPBP family intramembrane glutamic endopeptidase n=1 Tax=Saccharopolyspora indica TaxID=1229659 RepID=UPI0022EB5745|nr:CPBP family intramembrane glutamic endopeptidase [Saccharopolyspora indica]MDA3644067.1 CPBP family intramembrane metalloprotease [Saccharopolyspora indica]
MADRLLADRHSLPLSIALHLVPGALIVAVFLLFTGPVVKSWGYPSFLGWAIAMCVALVPFELGLLLWLGHRRNGRFSLRGVVHYRGRPISRGKLIAVVVPLIVWMLVVSTALIPLDDVINEWLFAWVPFEGAGSVTGYLAGYPRHVMVIALGSCIPLTGLAFPLVEELYFRGFLLPRLPQLGRGAPVLNAFLFAVYHLWAPWTFLSKTIFFLPAVWLVWRRKDIRISMGMHAGTTFVSQTGGTIALVLGVFP